MKTKKILWCPIIETIDEAIKFIYENGGDGLAGRLNVVKIRLQQHNNLPEDRYMDIPVRDDG